MTYDPKTNSLVIPLANAQSAYYCLKHALRHIRLSAGLPIDKYEAADGPLTHHDHASICLLELAGKLGIDMGVSNTHEHHKLDLRD